MSQLSHHTVSLPIHVSRRFILLGALLALASTAAVVLILAIGDTPSTDSTSAGAEGRAGLRPGGGPEESGVAASVGSRPSSGPSESATASSLAGSKDTVNRGGVPGGADGHRLAVRERAAGSGGPDESATAASVSGR